MWIVCVFSVTCEQGLCGRVKFIPDLLAISLGLCCSAKSSHLQAMGRWYTCLQLIRACRFFPHPKYGTILHIKVEKLLGMVDVASLR